MSLPTDLPSCGEPAIAVFEIFTRTATGYSLDGRLSVCGAHVVPALQSLRAADFEPHQATGTAGTPARCGDGFDYVARKPLTAPALASAAATPHPAWCDRTHADGTAHTASIGELDMPGDVTLTVELIAAGDATRVLVSVLDHNIAHETVSTMPSTLARAVARLLVDAADRLVQSPGQPQAHAFAVSRPYPAVFRWACICGHDIWQRRGESSADIRARLLQHSQGEDGLQLCPTGCGRVAGKCIGCTGVAR